ncbi:flagellar operon protein [Paenibacillus sp. V4I3]|uniref:TIGR02530 family flagellar biosynthesis protein n=1 Tax=unclassified Paenibacillus TaxID=185978 RepID=UPI00278B4709|nr:MULTISPECIES: TIGR02530 family flagellar biosynthesis protein [unclassified Paenibacillus]MDQ0876437.1 flagellar operon protein [Paenibacillus sp. V4I3]MDQ0887530.1 flagellar operon protein [Paenibacillus sp. V4I9]
MTERISLGQLYPNAVSPASTRRTPVQQPVTQSGNPTFQKLLQEQLVRFSHHAEVRLKERGIQLKPEQLDKLSTAIDKVAAKGAKDALMILGGNALIVNVPNRTVVTALDGNAMNEHVFTQIDSAIIIT